MEFYVWNKKDSILGLSANAILSSRPDLKYDDVLVIHDDEDKNKIVMIESKEELRRKYDIESTDPMVVGFIVSVILQSEPVDYIKELEDCDKKEDDKKENPLETYNDILEDVMSKINGAFGDGFSKDTNDVFIPLNVPYEEPECNVIDLSYVTDENINEKKLRVVIKHVAAIEPVNITDMRYMTEFNKKVDELETEREKYNIEANDSSLKKVNEQLNELDDEIADPYDATVKLEVNAIYQYDSNVMIDCKNGQWLIIQREAIDSIHSHAIEYEKVRDDGKGRHRVHYRTVDIELHEIYNEILERGNTVYIIAC